MSNTKFNQDTTPIAVIIPAAGFGKRMGGEIAKQFIAIGGKTILAHTVEKIQTWAKHYQHKIIIMIALSDGVESPIDISTDKDNTDNIMTCIGGKERADSVANALSVIAEQFTDSHTDSLPKWVMVHDAARPLVDIDDIEKLYQALKDDDIGGILAEKVTATVKKAQPTNNGTVITDTVPRDDLWLAQTPQLFRFDLLQQSLQGNRQHLTDEASGIEQMGLSVQIIEGNRNNIKITTPDDLRFFEMQMSFIQKR